MKPIWTRIELWLSTHAPEIFAELCDGAHPDDIRWAEAEIGVTFPEDVRESYLLHDGADGCAFLGWDFLSVNQIVKYWKILKLCHDRYDFAGGDRSIPPYGTGTPHGPIQPHWYNLGWIPFTESNGHHYCFDLVPTEGGRIGQVLMWDHHLSDRVLLASSFEGFWAQFAHELETGVRVLDEDGMLSVCDSHGSA